MRRRMQETEVQLLRQMRWGNEGMEVGIILAGCSLLYSRSCLALQELFASESNPCKRTRLYVLQTWIFSNVVDGQTTAPPMTTHMRATRSPSPTHDDPSPSPRNPFDALSLPLTFSDARCEHHLVSTIVDEPKVPNCNV